MPASYVVFDLLEVAGMDLRRRPYLERRSCLEDLLGRQLPHGLVLMPASNDPAVAEQWLINHCAAGIEGVVAKRCHQSYRPGKTKWQKVRTRVASCGCDATLQSMTSNGANALTTTGVVEGSVGRSLLAEGSRARTGPAPRVLAEGG
jgi:hypothetical protein